jgi:hypothetical protein
MSALTALQYVTVNAAVLVNDSTISLLLLLFLLLCVFVGLAVRAVENVRYDCNG